MAAAAGSRTTAAASGGRAKSAASGSRTKAGAAGSSSGGSAGPSTSSTVSASLDDYGDMHRLVLQGIMSAGYLDAKGVKKLFMGACSYLALPSEERTSMSYVQKVVRDINEKIRPYDMAIRSASCELTGKKFYVFLVTVEKPILRLQTLFTKFEVELFQKVMDTILRKYNSFSVPLTQCINLALDLETRGTLDHAEEFILKMIDLNYYAKFPISDDIDFNITLGVRAIRELEPILRESYSETIGKCSVCKVILLHGYLCPNCRLLIHKPCFQRFVSQAPYCPNCKVDWSDEVMIRRVRNEEEMEYDIDMNDTLSGASKGRSGLKDFDATSPPDLNVESPSDFPVTSPPDLAESESDDENLVMPALKAMSLEDSPSQSGAGSSKSGGGGSWKKNHKNKNKNKKSSRKN